MLIIVPSIIRIYSNTINIINNNRSTLMYLFFTLQTVNTNRLLNLCVVVFSSHSFWTSSSLDVPAGVTQDFPSTFFLRCVP